LFELLFLPVARVGENRFVKIGEYLRLFGFHNLAMIVMNMDLNIKDNVEPVTWSTIETLLAYWSSRRRSDFRCAAIRSALVCWGRNGGQGNRYAKHCSRSHAGSITNRLRRFCEQRSLRVHSFCFNRL
jgi:hypothetical protein